MLVVLIIVITLSEALGQFLLSEYHRSVIKHAVHYGPIPIYVLPFITWILYGLCTWLLLKSYKYTTMGKAEVYWDALSALIVPLIGALYYKSQINVIGWLGIGLIMIGTIMVAFEKELFKLIM
jgi:multidrug transporter EmrE-like cation transporter